MLNFFFTNFDVLKKGIHPERGKRLEVFVNSLNVKRKDFSANASIGYQLLSQLINNHTVLTGSLAGRVVAAYPQLSFNWLMEGEGDMLLSGYERGAVAAGHEAAEPQPQYGPKALTVDGLADVIRSLQDQLADHEARLRAAERAMAAKNTEGNE